MSWWVAASLPLLASCGRLAVLDPQGPAAAQIARDFWWLYWAAMFVVLVVFAVFALALLRRRNVAEAHPGAEPDVGADPHADAVVQRRGHAFVLYGGGLIPLLLIGGVTFFLVSSLAGMSGEPEEAAVQLRITGHMFWWEIEYLDDGFATANELHLPTGQPVRIELASADVIHSFWVPQLHGKMELVPGRTNVITLQADASGSFDGFCAEFCGAQHANMRLVVVAQAPEDYRIWAEGQQQDASLPDADESEQEALIADGATAFRELICSNCHTVRGVAEAAVEVGPDLTHLASRGTLAARTIPNTEEHLRRWIVDPQSIKPGSGMPATSVDAGDLDALLAFLGSLR